MELYIIIALLAVIACSELYRTYLGKRTRTKREHFTGKLQATRTMIWDFEFKIFKTREIREGIRVEYDYVQSRIDSLTTQIETWPADGNPDELGRLKDNKELAERDMKRFVAQMQELDIQVEGLRPSKDNPNGEEGITHQIDSLRELEAMLNDWIKDL